MVVNFTTNKNKTVLNLKETFDYFKVTKTRFIYY